MSTGSTIHLRARGEANAPMSMLFAVVSEHAGYSAWSAWDESSLEIAGQDDPNGVEAVRVLSDRTSVPGRIIEAREAVNLYWPPYMLGYRMLDERVVQDHQGLVLCRAVDTTTSRLIWHLSAKASVPSHTDSLREALTARLELLVTDACVEASRRHVFSTSD